MRTSPEDEGQARIRAELRTKPQSKAQYAYLQREFTRAANQGEVDRAYNLLRQLPTTERAKVSDESKFHFFDSLLEQARHDMIADIANNGTKNEKNKSLNTMS